MNVIKKTVALADDHVLLRNGLANLINTFGEYEVLFEADNGKMLTEKLQNNRIPDIVLLDINMPVMDGYETAMFLKTSYPEIKILALSMYDNELSIIRMLKNGARGYVLKDVEPSEMKFAMDSVIEKGYYYSDLVSNKLIHQIKHREEKIPNQSLNEREITFLKLVCTEKTYKEIAENMFVSPRTVDGYRDTLFEKLNVKSRVGLVLYAIRNNIVTL
jgi:two-component system, NarL family, invasion response regulator UvrY